MDILVYITDDKDRVLGGDPLTLYMPNNEEREEYLNTLSEMIEADVLQMKNGDHMIIKRGR